MSVSLTLPEPLLCHPKVPSLLFSQTLSSFGQSKPDNSKFRILAIHSSRKGRVSRKSSFKVMFSSSHSCPRLHPSLVLTTEGCSVSCMKFEPLLVQVMWPTQNYRVEKIVKKVICVKFCYVPEGNGYMVL